MRLKLIPLMLALALLAACSASTELPSQPTTAPPAGTTAPLATTAPPTVATTAPPETTAAGVIEYDGVAVNAPFGDFVAVSGDWIYYTYSVFSGFLEPSVSYIYKIRLDGTDETLVYTHADSIMHITADGDWIYFSAIKDGFVPDGSTGDYDYSQDYIALYKIRLDGSEKTELKANKHGYEWLYAHEGRLYYCTYGDSAYRIFRMRPDGAESIELTSTVQQPQRIINIIGERIYFSVYYWSSNKNVYYRVNTDGSGEQVLGTQAALALSPYIIDGWSYKNSYAGGDLYSGAFYNLIKVNVETGERVELNDENSWFVCAAGDRVYYYNPDERNIFSVKTDGTDRLQITDGVYRSEYDTVESMIVAGDWIYYRCESRMSGPGPLCRIKTDGTGFQVLYSQ